MRGMGARCQTCSRQCPIITRRTRPRLQTVACEVACNRHKAGYTQPLAYNYGLQSTWAIPNFVKRKEGTRARSGITTRASWRIIPPHLARAATHLLNLRRGGLSVCPLWAQSIHDVRVSSKVLRVGTLKADIEREFASSTSA